MTEEKKLISACSPLAEHLPKHLHPSFGVKCLYLSSILQRHIYLCNCWASYWYARAERSIVEGHSKAWTGRAILTCQYALSSFHSQVICKKPNMIPVRARVFFEKTNTFWVFTKSDRFPQLGITNHVSINSVPLSTLQLYTKKQTCLEFVYRVKPVSSTKT